MKRFLGSLSRRSSESLVSTPPRKFTNPIYQSRLKRQCRPPRRLTRSHNRKRIGPSSSHIEQNLKLTNNSDCLLRIKQLFARRGTQASTMDIP